MIQIGSNVRQSTKTDEYFFKCDKIQEKFSVNTLCKQMVIISKRINIFYKIHYFALFNNYDSTLHNTYCVRFKFLVKLHFYKENYYFSSFRLHDSVKFFRLLRCIHIFNIFL